MNVLKRKKRENFIHLIYYLSRLFGRSFSFVCLLNFNRFSCVINFDELFDSFESSISYLCLGEIFWTLFECESWSCGSAKDKFKGIWNLVINCLGKRNWTKIEIFEDIHSIFHVTLIQVTIFTFTSYFIII